MLELLQQNATTIVVVLIYNVSFCIFAINI